MSNRWDSTTEFHATGTVQWYPSNKDVGKNAESLEEFEELPMSRV